MVRVQRFLLAIGYFVCCSALKQSETNGLSTYGTLHAPHLPVTLDCSSNPWGDVRPGSDKIPKTNVTRKYTFEVSRSIIAPDGVQKNVILINGQFPGPIIEACWGDLIEVKVKNNIQNVSEGLTVHWHGQPQRFFQSQDGVPGIMQCPIPPGSSYTYKFRAESFGTSWYHSHVSGQYSDGLFGPLIVYGPEHVTYDIDLGPIMLGDYTHKSYIEVLKELYVPNGTLPNIDNNLINGKGQADCVQTDPAKPCSPDAGLSKFRFSPNKIHRLRLINTGSTGTQKFTIDGHNFTVFANDYVAIEPYDTDVITLGIGQRADVLVKATGKGAYWMRSDLDKGCLGHSSTISQAKAVVLYPDAGDYDTPTTTATPWQSNNCANDPLSQTVPFYPINPPQSPSTTQILNINLTRNDTGIRVFTVNNQSFYADYNEPILEDVIRGQITFDPKRNVYNFGQNDSVRVVIYNYVGAVHPMHLHGHDFWVLAEGTGTWDGHIEGDPKNPQRRDVQILRPGSKDNATYIVLEWKQDNPGVWPLHCHTGLHVSSGLLINVLERPDDIRKMKESKSTKHNCDAWNRFTAHNSVDQIDSGL